MTEQNTEGSPIRTRIPEIISMTPETSDEVMMTDHQPNPRETFPLADIDAAVLMATDGYGKGRIRGKDEKNRQVVVTTEKAHFFNFETSPEPEQLYVLAENEFKNITKSKGLRH